MSEIDRTDLRILAMLQRDCTTPVVEIGREVGLSTTPCWRRIQKLEQDGTIERRVALLNPQKLGVGVTVFVFITAGRHSEDWLARFHAAIEDLPEVVELYRMSGQVDYLLRVVVPDIQHYDQVYKKLIARVECKDISSSFAMEQIKFTTELPLEFATEKAKK